MTFRRLPGLLLLGLLAALLAHTGSYGSGHEAGGVYHTVLILTAIAGVGGLAVTATMLALLGSRRHGDGSVLAAALRPMLPGPGALWLCASGWFGVIEALEPRHESAALLLIAAALVLAVTLVGAFARAFVRALAEIVFLITAPAHRLRGQFSPRWLAPPPSARAVAFAYRRFARPPPV